MSISLFALDVAELFDVLPNATMAAWWIDEPDQIGRWETLNGDHRDAKEIVSNPMLRAGAAYWVDDALHALVLRDAALRQQHTAEAMFDHGREQYVVLVSMATA